MHPFLAAEPWHYWLSFVIFGGAVLAVIATVVGYLFKVTSNRYPKR
jgi:hypothetical protein